MFNRKTEKKTLIMVFGTFDYLHAGHENLFTQARQLGDEIITIIARDRTVKTIKGQFPDHDEKTRLRNLKETGWSNYVVLGNHKDKVKVIKEYRPDTVALGYDQYAFTYGLEKMIIDLGLNMRIVRLKPYRPDMYKSSIVKKNLGTSEKLSEIPLGKCTSTNLASAVDANIV